MKEQEHLEGRDRGRGSCPPGGRGRGVNICLSGEGQGGGGRGRMTSASPLGNRLHIFILTFPQQAPRAEPPWCRGRAGMSWRPYPAVFLCGSQPLETRWAPTLGRTDLPRGPQPPPVRRQGLPAAQLCLPAGARTLPSTRPPARLPEEQRPQGFVRSRSPVELSGERKPTGGPEGRGGGQSTGRRGPKAQLAHR